MTSSLDMIRGRSNVVTLTNNSGGGLIAGDVCVQDTSADEKATTTTSANSVLKVFVAAETIASGAAGRFYESGYVPLVNVNASVTRGRFLFTHTVAKQAAENATYGAGAFGKILKSGTTPSAILYSATAQVSGAGTITGSSGSTDNALIRADGTGGSTVQSSAATIDDSGTVNIPTGQTYNINNTPHTHASSGALVLLEQHAASNSATLDFTTFISSTYDEYLFEFVNIVPATNAAGLDMLAGTGGGPSYDNTAGHYAYHYHYNVSNASASGGSDSAALIELQAVLSSNALYNGGNGHIRLFNPQDATNYKAFNGMLSGYATANSKGATQVVGGWFLQSTAMTAVRFQMSSGNISSGTIRVYGIAKS